VWVTDNPHRRAIATGELDHGRHHEQPADIDDIAAKFTSAVDRPDALVNNARVMIPARQATSKGLELNWSGIPPLVDAADAADAD
jgi:NAD(P)-dependent dehydrogenase (short-subunit alcohol dehydrogenase family)